jgi:rSAM/selenodomain-associated transferase 1
MKEALAVMAKAPRVGEVKTRLIGALTAEEVTLLYTAFLNDTFALMEAAAEEREELSLVLCYTPEGQEEAFEEIEREGSMMIPQRGGDLGERLGACFEDLFALGFESVIVIGADSPTLPWELAADAFDAMTEENDVVLGPTRDGGFYLIGMRKLDPRVFERVSWSSDQALAMILERVEEIGASGILAPEWYDIDTPEDLELLKNDLRERKAIARYSSRILKQIGNRLSS